MKALKKWFLRGTWIFFFSYLSEPFIYVIHAKAIAREHQEPQKGQNGGHMDYFIQLQWHKSKWKCILINWGASPSHFWVTPVVS